MSDNSAASDELVGVKVPRRHLMAVYGFLATLDRRARADIDTEGPRLRPATSAGPSRICVASRRRRPRPATPSGGCSTSWPTTPTSGCRPARSRQPLESLVAASRARSRRSRATFGRTTGGATGCWPTSGGQRSGPASRPRCTTCSPLSKPSDGRTHGPQRRAEAASEGRPRGERQSPHLMPVYVPAPAVPSSGRSHWSPRLLRDAWNWRDATTGLNAFFTALKPFVPNVISEPHRR